MATMNGVWQRLHWVTSRLNQVRNAAGLLVSLGHVLWEPSATMSEVQLLRGHHVRRPQAEIILREKQTESVIDCSLGSDKRVERGFHLRYKI